MSPRKKATGKKKEKKIVRCIEGKKGRQDY